MTVDELVKTHEALIYRFFDQNRELRERFSEEKFLAEAKVVMEYCAENYLKNEENAQKLNFSTIVLAEFNKQFITNKK